MGGHPDQLPPKLLRVRLGNGETKAMMLFGLDPGSEKPQTVMAELAVNPAGNLIITSHQETGAVKTSPRRTFPVL